MDHDELEATLRLMGWEFVMMQHDGDQLLGITRATDFIYLANEYTARLVKVWQLDSNTAAITNAGAFSLDDMRLLWVAANQSE